MTWLLLHPRHSRLGATVALALAGLFATSQNAYACLDTCVSTFGSTFKVGADQFWELESCTQYYNAGGGITTKCYYKVTTFDPM